MELERDDLRWSSDCYIANDGLWLVDESWTGVMPLLNEAMLALLFYNLYNTQLFVLINEELFS